MKFGVIPVIQKTFTLMQRYGLMLYLDFLAANTAAITLLFLAFPDLCLPLTSSGEAENLLPYLINPNTIIYSLVYAPITAMTVLYVWQKEGAVLPARNLFYANLLPLLVLSLFLDHMVAISVILFVFPAIALSAVTSAFIPALVIENAGWQAIARSFAMTKRYFWPLCATWCVVLVPWLVLGVLRAAESAPVQTEDLYQLWVNSIMSSFFIPFLSATSICLMVAIYKRLLELENGGSNREIRDIFR